MPATAVWLLATEARYRAALSLVLLSGVIAVGVLALVFVASFAWPQDVIATPKSHIAVGNIRDFEIGEPAQFAEGKFWLVRLSEREVIALYWKDPHLGCTVPWRPQLTLYKQSTGESKQGWFRNPCHGETYDIQGRCVGGPCARSLDRRPLVLTSDGTIVVDIADYRLIKGQPARFEPWVISSSQSLPR